MKSTKSGSCTATIGASPRSGGSTIVAPAAANPSCSTSPRSGSSSPASRTPSQYPPSGAWPRWRGDHTTGICKSVTTAESRWHATLSRMPPPPPRPRARQFGLTFGTLSTGEHNAITDVPGVCVGQVTVWRDDEDGSVARTGCTVVRPDAIDTLWRVPMAAGVAVLNGAGELTGSFTAREWGTLASPVVLVSTNNIGRGFDAVVDATLAAGIANVVDPVVGECDDRHLDDITKRWLTVEHVREAIDSAVSGPVAEGVVGAGTGMSTMGHKGGVGTASRVLDGLGTVGVLLLCNFGGSKLLR